MKIAGLTELDRVLNTKTATRVISFPDGINRTFTLLARQWFIYDACQLRCENSALVANLAYKNARQTAIDLSRGPDLFEHDLRFCFEDILKHAAAYVDMPGDTDGGNDNVPGR